MDCCVLSVKSKLAVMERGEDSSVVFVRAALYKTHDVVSRKGNQRFLIVLDGSYLLPTCPRCIQAPRLRCPGRRSRCTDTGGQIQVSHFCQLQHFATLISSPSRIWLSAVVATLLLNYVGTISSVAAFIPVAIFLYSALSTTWVVLFTSVVLVPALRSWSILLLATTIPALLAVNYIYLFHLWTGLSLMIKVAAVISLAGLSIVGIPCAAQARAISHLPLSYIGASHRVLSQRLKIAIYCTRTSAPLRTIFPAVSNAHTQQFP